MSYNDNRKRWEILDRLFSGEHAVSSDEIFAEWKNRGILPKSYSESESTRKQYELSLRQDIFKFRKIYKESGLEGPLFADVVSKTDTRRKLYQYYRRGWSILPLIFSNYSRSDWHALDTAMNKLKKDIPRAMAGQIDFFVMSRLNILRGRDKTVDWPDGTNQLGFEMLPLLHDAVIQKQPVQFEFAMFGESPNTCILHPYLLKEFNGRWYCLGYREDKDELWPISVDRITIGSIHTVDLPYKEYKSADGLKPYSYFENIIGVTKEYNSFTADYFMLENKEYIVRLGVRSFRAWMYLITNPIHHSQTILKDYDASTNYGAVTISVIPNIEMYHKILGLGRDICLEEPLFAKKNLKLMIEDILHQYHNN